MDIEEKIFKKYNLIFKKLEKYGFVKEKEIYKLKTNLGFENFEVEIQISKNSDIKGKIIDKETNEEYFLYRTKNQEGAFAGKVREKYENILIDIQEKCTTKNYFAHPQSNRITDLIIKKYGDYPEFLWEKFDGSGIFRNQKTKKWYAAILDVDRSRLQNNKKGAIEVINLKLEPDLVLKLIKMKGFYPAYHMNKKYWISIILDESVDDDKIIKLIDKSYCLVS